LLLLLLVYILSLLLVQIIDLRLFHCLAPVTLLAHR